MKPSGTVTTSSGRTIVPGCATKAQPLWLTVILDAPCPVGVAAGERDGVGHGHAVSIFVPPGLADLAGDLERLVREYLNARLAV
jgi:hypothetical protein